MPADNNRPGGLSIEGGSMLILGLILLSAGFVLSRPRRLTVR